MKVFLVIMTCGGTWEVGEPTGISWAEARDAAVHLRRPGQPLKQRMIWPEVSAVLSEKKSCSRALN